MRLWLVLMLASGCVALPPGPMERLSNAAFDLNTATRFGRMDIAAASVAAESRADFGRRHRAWGKEIRIVDVELEGVQVLDEGAAEVDLTVSWQRADEAVIRSTTLAQRWTQTGSDWKLVDETASSGSPGLFPVKKKARTKKPDGGKEALGSSVDLPKD